MTEAGLGNEAGSPLPGVSVIVPVYNDREAVGLLLDSLLGQTYPKDRLEILAVDNGSTDGSGETLRQYPVRVLEERSVQSSYAARNRAIRAARYEMLAFVDSDCRAEPDWLAEGVQTLTESGADLAGGKVEFTCRGEPTAAELFDSLRHFNFEKTIRENRGTGAGNLFTYKRVFERIGMFPEVVSGGDFQWSRRAIEAGCRAVFAPGAVVRHPARRMGQILRKQVRTGRGYVHARLAQGHSAGHELPYHFGRLVCTGLPIRQVRAEIAESGRAELRRRMGTLVWTGWLCSLAYRWGSLREIVNVLFGKKRNKS